MSWKINHTQSITNRPAWIVGSIASTTGRPPSATRAILINSNGQGKFKYRTFCINQLSNTRSTLKDGNNCNNQPCTLFPYCNENNFLPIPRPIIPAIILSKEAYSYLYPFMFLIDIKTDNITINITNPSRLGISPVSTLTAEYYFNSPLFRIVGGFGGENIDGNVVAQGNSNSSLQFNSLTCKDNNNIIGPINTNTEPGDRRGTTKSAREMQIIEDYIKKPSFNNKINKIKDITSINDSLIYFFAALDNIIQVKLYLYNNTIIILNTIQAIQNFISDSSGSIAYVDTENADTPPTNSESVNFNGTKNFVNKYIRYATIKIKKHTDTSLNPKIRIQHKRYFNSNYQQNSKSNTALITRRKCI